MEAGPTETRELPLPSQRSLLKYFEPKMGSTSYAYDFTEERAGRHLVAQGVGAALYTLGASLINTGDA